MMSCPSMSKQSDGLMKVINDVEIVGDCQVDYAMRMFLPGRSISYSDYTDWNYNST